MFIWSCIEKLSFLKINWVPSYTEICLIKVHMVASCGFMGSSLILRKTSKLSKKGNGQDRDEDLVSVWLFSVFFFLIGPSLAPQTKPTNLQGSQDFHQMLCFS